jgi:putative zinc finger/helix-turn-helix YgiT family protein
VKRMKLVKGRYSANVKHDGRAYHIEIPRLEFYQCEKCSDSIVLTDSADEIVGRALRKAAGLLLPEEIRDIREHFGLSQKQLADLLGIGEATVCRWETGVQIQQRAFDKMLRAYQNVPAFQKYLQELPAASPV